MKSLKKDYAIVIMIVLILLLVTTPVWYKEDIHNATFNELTEIHGIGSELAVQIQAYCIANPSYSANDLIEINGIGEIRLKEIKKVYR